MVFSKSILLFAVIAIQYFATNGIIIELPDGEVEGITTQTTAHTTFHSFLAMRYAKPPVGDLRFQPPQPLDPWNSVFNATAEKHVCYQTDHDSPKESEDCLFINVFTPEVDLWNTSETKLPVMVFIHGGAFFQGTGYKIEGGVGPDFFMDNGVVFAAFNYRLGPFGFASTQDSVLPGNLGLKDQVMALKWVQNNIEYFGGDPNKVTIFGQSAGGASVSYHLLSPQSKGLFVGAIQESGSAVDLWAYQPDQKAITQQTAAVIRPNAGSYESNDILSILKEASAEEIDKASYAVLNNVTLRQGFVYSPVVELESEDAFITESMYSLFESGKFNNVPTIIGMNSEECLGYVEGQYDFSYLEKWHTTLVPGDMYITDQTTLNTVGELIYDFHVGKNNVKFTDNIAYPIKYFSMNNFDKGAIKQAELQSKHSNSVWFYDLTYDGPMGNNIVQRLNQWIPGMGNVTHSEELNYIFSRWYSADVPDNSNPKYFPESDWTVHDRIMALWTNYAKYQNPTPTKDELLQNKIWSNVDPQEFKYLDIGKDLNVVNQYPKDEMYKFWSSLYDKYAVSPLYTF